MAFPKTEVPDDAGTAIDRFERRKARSGAESTAARYASCLRKFAAWLEDRGESFDSVTVETVEDFLFWLQDEEYAERTQNVYRSAILAFYDDKVGKDENPAREVDFGRGQWQTKTRKQRELRQEVEYLSVDEVKELVEHVPKPQVRNRLIVRLLFATGVRASELVNIRLQDIDRQNRTIRIYTQKSDEYRVVGYQPALSRLMSVWLDVQRPVKLYAEESPYLFPTDNSERLSIETLGYVVTTAAENAGLQEVLYESKSGSRNKITVHTLRHSFAVNAIKNGMPLPLLKEALGHSDIDITQIYLEVTGKDVEDAYRDFGPSIEAD